MCGHFALYGRVKLRRSMKIEMDELFEPLVAQINRMPPR